MGNWTDNIGRVVDWTDSKYDGWLIWQKTSDVWLIKRIKLDENLIGRIKMDGWFSVWLNIGRIG